MPQPSAPQASPFVEYLSQPDVFTRLVKNNCDYLSQSTLETDNVGLISRCFNNLPNTYPYFGDLLFSLPEALGFQELDVWLDLAICYALDDLFDHHGKLRQDVKDLLSVATNATTPVTMDDFMAAFGEEEVKTQILGGYINLLSDIAINTVLKEMMAKNESALVENSPMQYFSSILNRRVRDIDHIDARFIASYQRKLDKAVLNRWLWSAELRSQLVAYIGKDTPSITDTLATLFGAGKRKVASIAEQFGLREERVISPRPGRVIEL